MGQKPTETELAEEMDLHEVAAALGRMEAKIDQALFHVGKINGRISSLEEWRVEQEKLRAYEEGAKQARQGVVLTRRHLAVIVGALTIGGALADTALELIR